MVLLLATRQSWKAAKLESSGSAGDAQLEAELTDCSLESEEVTEASTDLSPDSMFLGFLICFVL